MVEFGKLGVFSAIGCVAWSIVAVVVFIGFVVVLIVQNELYRQ